MTTFGTLLRQFRVAAALSQEALAERCRIGTTTIAALERGRRQSPRLSTVRLIADVLQLGPTERALLVGAATGATSEVGPPAGSTRARAKVGPGARLPVPLTPLFGRQAESQTLAQVLGTERLVTLLGPGGVGKTRLAILVADQTAPKFAGGTWWVELGLVEDSEKVPEALLRALGGSEQPNVPIGEQVLAALPEEPVLLVLDNCEQVVDAVADLVADLLAHPSITVLATSRQALAVPGEVRWPVPALTVPPGASFTADALVDVDSVQLLVERAARAYPHFRLTDSNADAAARICRRLEGIPLAIELAAARANAESLSQLARELEERVPLAASSARGVPARHSTLLACVDWSYRLLSTQERAAFRCLAGFAGSFSADAFSAVARLVGPPDSDIGTAGLSRLVEKSLVTSDPETGRYRALETIRVFASDRADEASELEAVRNAHRDYFLSWLSGLGAADATDDVLDRIDLEYANIRAALVWSIESRSPKAAAIVSGIGVAWHQQNRFHDARALGDEALAIAAQTDKPAWARAVGALGPARALGGDLHFRSVVAEAEAIAREAHDLLAEGQCRFAQGYGAPFDASQLVAAHELGLAAPSPLLAGVAAAALASGGVDDEREDWLERACRLIGGLENSTVRANYQLARSDFLMERASLQEALDLAVASALDRRVMPTTRMLGIGRALQVAMYRTDPGAHQLLAQMTGELAHVWPMGASWRTSSWTAFGGLLQLWLALLHGEALPEFPPQELRRLTRLAVTPSVVRCVFRAAIQTGRRPDAPLLASLHVVPPTAGSLMAASMATVEGARAAVDGEDELAKQLWVAALRMAAPNDWRLLACDCVEALGGLASRAGDAATAAQLLTSAQRRRQDLDYSFRYGFEQDQLDRAWAVIGGTSKAVPGPLPWSAAVHLALTY